MRSRVNTCRTWEKKSKTLRGSHGNCRIIDAWTRRRPLPSSLAAVTSGTSLETASFRACRDSLVVTGFPRNILLFPMGNSNGQANDMVSVYLNYGDQKASEGWHVCAQFCLAISNPNDPTVYIQSRTSRSLRCTLRVRCTRADTRCVDVQRLTTDSRTRSKTGDSRDSSS